MTTDSAHRVLISYAHEDPIHRDRVLALADALRAHGVDTWIDRYAPWPRDGWERWMERQIAGAAVVICVCSQAYATLFAAGSDSGVGYEARLVRSWIARDDGPRFLPVTFTPDRTLIPPVLGASSRFLPPDAIHDPGRSMPSDPAFNALLRDVLGQPEHEAPRLGERARVRSEGAVTAATSDHDVDPAHADALLAYLDWVVERSDQVQTGRSGTRRPLQRLYVYPRERALGGGEAMVLEDLVRRAPKGRWVIQGDPGAGKTTLLRHLALDLATGTAAALEGAHVLGPGTVPVIVSLPAWAHGGGRPEDYAAVEFVDDPPLAGRRGNHVPSAVRAALTYAADHGRLLYLLDGLDEVAPRDRATLNDRLHRLATPEHDCAVALTTRRFGYDSPSDRYEDYEILPFNSGQQRELLGRLLPEPPGLADEVLAEAQQKPRLADLITNPLMLSLLADVARDGAPGSRLPSRRLELYDWIVARLLRSRRPPDQEGDKVVRNALGELAFRLIEQGGGTWAWPPSAVDAAVNRCAGLRAAMGDADPCHWLATRCGLLSESNGTEVGRVHTQRPVQFLHRSLLEFLAAEHLASSPPGLAAQVAGRLLGDAGALATWAEVYAFYVGLAVRPLDALRTLEEINPALATRALPNVEEIDMDAVLGFLGITGDPLSLVREILARVRDGTASGRLLARLARDRGDTDSAALCAAGCFAIGDEEGLDSIRRGLPGENLAPYAWVRVPEIGDHVQFEMGTEGGAISESPRHRVTLGAYSILNVPVTRALFAVVSGRDPTDPRRSWLAPVGGVSWYDAIDFCIILSNVRGTPTPYDRAGHEVAWTHSHQGVRLPTEAEWECAGRAGTNSRWSFGDDGRALEEYAWLHTNSGDETHPVGQKRPNPWGLYDIHGNVLEWCWDCYQTRYHVTGPRENPIGPSSPAVRVLRGGSCWDGADGCRSAFRNGTFPTRAMAIYGFRIVLAPPPR